MKVVISSGHGKYISGAIGPSPWGLHEHTEAVRVVDQTAIELRNLGVEVVTYEDTVSHSQDENLNRIVSFHNAQGSHDLDVSVHFNSTDPQPTGPVGCEMYYASQAGMEFADQMVDDVCTASGLKNRGPKDGSGLYFCRNTANVAVLAEICFVNSHADVDIYHAKFNDICAALAASIAGENVAPGPTPPQPPDVAHRTLKKGDKGDDVVALQKSLGVLIPDGDFGSITDTWVRAFQAACGIGADGIVGNATWAQVDDLDFRVEEGEPPLPSALVDQIYTMAQESEIADYSWPDRGVMPPGYIAGMALSFAYALRMGGAAVDIMEKAQGSSDKDALAWYEQEFAALGMHNKSAGLNTMRHLFVMMIGLGPRESSGKYCEGRDMSASNVASDTCEAGLFQTSWNIRSGSSTIEPLLPEFWDNPNGFLLQFKEGISPTSNNLNSYGSGDGVRYQWLSRFCPLFHVMVTGVGMRVLRAHWGPIGRREVTLKKEADELLQSVQELVLGVV